MIRQPNEANRTKETHVDQIFAPLEPAHPPAIPATPPPVEPAAVEPRPIGLRRIVLTGAISALLLVGGGVAVVSAASPAPSAVPGTTAPSSGTGATGPHHGSSVNCPNMGGSGGPGSSSGTAPTPAT